MAISTYWGTFDPETDYTLTVSPDLTDLWGSSLGRSLHALHFRTGATQSFCPIPVQCRFHFPNHQAYRSLLVQVTNISSHPLSVGTLIDTTT